MSRLVSFAIFSGFFSRNTLHTCVRCASRYQKKLQDNLMTLASLADAQATPQQQAQPNPGQPQPGAPGQ